MCDNNRQELQRIKIDLPEGLDDELVELYVETNLSFVSKEHFKYQQTIGRTFEEALYDAVLNEIVNDAIVQLVINEEDK